MYFEVQVWGFGVGIVGVIDVVDYIFVFDYLFFGQVIGVVLQVCVVVVLVFVGFELVDCQFVVFIVEQFFYCVIGCCQYWCIGIGYDVDGIVYVVFVVCIGEGIVQL